MINTLIKYEFVTEKRLLKELMPANYNPRKMTEKENSDLRKSLGKFGLTELPLINKDNTIISGHQRVRLLSDAYGLNKEIEVRVPMQQLSEEDEKELNIRSNKNNGSWDWDKLANEFDITELIDWGFEDWEIGGGVEKQIENPKEKEENNFIDINTIKLEYEKDTYIAVLEKISEIKKNNNLKTNEDVLLFLLN